jgi:hypothetical protein
MLSPENRRDANRLLDVLQRERNAERPANTRSSLDERAGADRRGVVIERAKGALMHHYGIDSHQRSRC